MQVAVKKHGLRMIHPNTDRLLLGASYLLNIGAWFSGMELWIKILLGVITAITTIMAFFNQWNTFKKNYRTLWIVVRIEHIFTFLKPKKRRHRGISLTKSKHNKYP